VSNNDDLLDDAEIRARRVRKLFDGWTPRDLCESGGDEAALDILAILAGLHELPDEWMRELRAIADGWAALGLIEIIRTDERGNRLYRLTGAAVTRSPRRAHAAPCPHRRPGGCAAATRPRARGVQQGNENAEV
jgi:hypothetical protein